MKSIWAFLGPPVIDLTGDPPSRPKVPPEDQVPTGCSLLSMEPLREWFCRGADTTSPAEFEAALYQLETNPPNISRTGNSQGLTTINSSYLQGIDAPRKHELRLIRSVGPCEVNKNQKNVRNPNHHYFSKNVTIHLQSVLQYASNSYWHVLLVPLRSEEREILSVFISQHSRENRCGCGHREVPHKMPRTIGKHLKIGT